MFIDTKLFLSDKIVLMCFRSGGLAGDSPVDLVLSCVDNFEARMAINTVSSAQLYSGEVFHELTSHH